MARKPNLNSGDFKKFKKKQSALATQTPLSSTAVERGSTRWLTGSYVEINGTLDVTGQTTISGALNVSGTTTLSGSTTIAGPTGITGALTIAGSMDVTGPSTFSGTLGIDGATTIAGELGVTGPTTLAGTLDITGETTLAANLNVTAGGKITAGQTVIEPNGKATFGTFIIDPASNKLIQAPGGWMFSDGVDHLGLSSSLTSSVQLSSSYAELNYDGSSVVRAEPGLINLNAPQTSVNGKLVVTSTLAVTGISTLTGRLITKERVALQNTPMASAGFVANVYMDANGFIYKTA